MPSDFDIKPVVNAIYDELAGSPTPSNLDIQPGLNAVLDIIAANTGTPTVTIQDNGIDITPARNKLNFVGATIADNPTNGTTDITITGTGGGAVDSVNGQTGVVVLTQDDISNGLVYKQYSQTERTKLSGIESGAQVNTVVSVSGKTGVVVLDKNDVGLSNVDNTSDLNKPISTATQTALNNKQDTLVSGTNIKTINSTSLLGSGDISISATPGGSDTQVQFNNAGAFGGDANFTFNSTTDTLIVPNIVSATTGDVPLIIGPSGTGAMQAQPTTSTVVGGNVRGANATDLQRSRALATQVASGSGSTVIGINNLANAAYSTSLGFGNINQGTAGSAIGNSNQITTGAPNGFAGGGANLLSGSGSAALGVNNNVSGTNGFAAGNQNIVSGPLAASAIGILNDSTGQSSFTQGNRNVANSIGGFVNGEMGTTKGVDFLRVQSSNIYTQSGKGTGQAQYTRYITAVQTNDNTPTITRSSIFPATIQASNQFTLNNNSAVTFYGTVIATITAGGDTKSWKIEGTIKRGINAASTTFVGTPTVTVVNQDAGSASWDVALSVNTTIGCMSITVTGQTGRTIRWFAHINNSEVGF